MALLVQQVQTAVAQSVRAAVSKTACRRFESYPSCANWWILSGTGSRHCREASPAHTGLTVQRPARSCTDHRSWWAIYTAERNRLLPGPMSARGRQPLPPREALGELPVGAGSRASVTWLRRADPMSCHDLRTLTDARSIHRSGLDVRGQAATFPLWCNGSTFGSGPKNRGSNPCGGARNMLCFVAACSFTRV